MISLDVRKIRIYIYLRIDYSFFSILISLLDKNYLSFTTTKKYSYFSRYKSSIIL